MLTRVDSEKKRREKNVIRVVDSESAITHSVTVMPMLFADGTVAKDLFIVLQEPQGRFPAAGHYVADNLVVRCNTSHPMNQQLYIDWFQNCVLPVLQPKPLMLVDSWSSFKRHDLVLPEVPSNKQL